MTTERHSSGPLGDLRVIELTDERGQWCGKLLADHGADVIKVEPRGGAAERNIGPFYHDEPHPERSLHFWHYNTSKRGVTLDLETETGRDLLRKLIATADVLLESYRPGYLPSLGLGYEELKAINPRLVMCSITPFGQAGPWRDFQTSDLIHLAAGGQMGLSGYDEEDYPDAPPIAPGGGNAWHIAGHYAYIGLMSAVIFRDFTGTGQYLDVSVHASCALTTEMHLNAWVYAKKVVRRRTGRHASLEQGAKTQMRTKDGKYINMSGGFLLRLSPASLKPVVDWMERYGMAEDLKDPMYDDPTILQANFDHIVDVFTRFIGSISQEEAYHGGQALGYSWGAIRAPEETLDDEHWHDRGFFVQVEHPELGETFTYPGAGAIFPKSPPTISRRAPLIGEHNVEVFGELGVAREDLVLLRETGVI